MARSTYYHDPSRKHIEQFNDFSGGLNSVNSNDTLADKEMPRLENYELGDRGSLVRKAGSEVHWTPPTPGNPQGFFRYYKADGTFDEIKVVGGRFYVNELEVNIVGIQTTRPMEAVQYKDKLYIASGSGLLQYDGTSITKVTPYTPKPLEALYVGTNGLAQDPNNYIQTTSSHSVLTVKGVQFAERYGLQNEQITMNAYAEKVNEADVLEWKFERRLPSHREGVYFLDQDWSTNSTYSFTTEWTGDIQIRVSVRKQGSTEAADTYHVPQYLVKPAKDPDDELIDSDTINNCNRILLHWERIILYGDTAKPDVIYISHLKNPAYVPIVNTLQFENPRREGLTSLVRFRDNIVAFTETTVQALFGKGTVGEDTFRRVMMNSSIGCIAPYSARVVNNYVVFLSYEGVYYLKSLAYTESKANVSPIDLNIHNKIPRNQTNACAIVSDKQYKLSFPSSNQQFRFYYDEETWAEDTHANIDYHNMYLFDGEVYIQGSDGRIVKESNVLTDEGLVYEAVVETKAYPFREPHATKKIKEVQVRTEVSEPTTITVELIIDDVVVKTENLSLVPTQELYKISGFGKGFDTKLRITHKEAKTFKLLGIAFIFKAKNP